MKKLYFLFFFLMAYAMSAQLVLNETLFDPASGITGDANRDGTRDASEDEFIEFVNSSDTTLDISGYQVFDISGGKEVLRHTVPPATTILAGGIYVVFSGGDLSTISEDFPSVIFHLASTGSLSLNNGLTGDFTTIVEHLIIPTPIVNGLNNNASLLGSIGLDDTMYFYGTADHNGRLYKSTDYGESLILLVDLKTEFPSYTDWGGWALRVLPNNELFYSTTVTIKVNTTGLNERRTYTFVSSNNQTTWTQSQLTTTGNFEFSHYKEVNEDGDITFEHPSSHYDGWGFDTYNNYVVLTEYGEGVGIPDIQIGHTPGGYMTAGSIYLSEDYGITFKEIFSYFNMPDNLPALSPAIGGYHSHGVFMDPYKVTNGKPRIFGIMGDLNYRLVFTDDLGITWKDNSTSRNNYQPPVSGMAIPQGYITGTDAIDSQGIQITYRGEDTFYSEELHRTLDVVDEPFADPNNRGRIVHVGAMFYQREAGFPIITGVTPEAPEVYAWGSRGKVLASWDNGLTWNTIFKDRDTNPYWQGITNMRMFQDSKKQIWVSPGQSAYNFGDGLNGRLIKIVANENSDNIVVKDSSDNVLITFNQSSLFLSTETNQSVARNPSITGNFHNHYVLDRTSYSPGLLTNSAPFSNTSSLIINEIHLDPQGTITGDANNDGIRNPSEDEFIEFFNKSSSPLDISNYKIYDASSYVSQTPRHTVPASTIIPAGNAFLVFGGGTPKGSFGSALVQISSSGSLDLTNSGEVIYIEDASGTLIYQLETSEMGLSFPLDQAVTRDPDISGNFIKHLDATPSIKYSPGLKADGSTFHITVTADTKTKVYGDQDTALTYAITSGSLAIGDVLTGNLSRTVGEDVGTYAIISTLANPNYAITFVSADVSITANPITIAADTKTKVYGEHDPPLTYVIISGSLIADDFLTGSLSRTEGEDVGTYPKTSTLSNSNYAITFISSNLSITASSINITAVAGQTKVYGTTDPTFSYKITGLVNGDLEVDLDTPVLIARAAGEDVGEYLITPSEAADANYIIDFATSNFNITKTSLTVKANTEQTKVYGEQDPTFSYTLTGFVNGDVETDLDTPVLIARTVGEDVGAYIITPSEAADANYIINFATANFNITKTGLTVKANTNQTKVYGEQDPTFSYTLTGFVNDDLETDLDTPVLIARTVGEGVGEYIITPYEATDSNYIINFATANFNITKTALTITADTGQVKVYGTTDPTFSYSITGFVNGDIEADLDTPVIILRTTGEDVGTYAIAIFGAGDANYTASFVANTFSIVKASQSITFDSLMHTDDVFDLIASTSSGLPVTFTSSNIAVAKISGNTINILTPGFSIITASQVGNNNHEEAISVTQILEIQVLNLNTSSLSNLKIYPNPGTDYLYLEGNINPVTVSIYDVLGKKVISINNTNKIDVKVLPKGVYIIRVLDGLKEVRKKFIRY
jgi:hypothetical protein